MDTIVEDDDLVAKIVAGNVAAFQELVRSYQKRITALGMRFFKNLADAEDFVQEVFLKLYTKIYTFRGESLFSTWCTKLAYNVAINSTNRKKEQENLDADALPTCEPGPEENRVREDTLSALRKEIRNLPERYAMPIRLYFFQHLPYNKISDIMALPVNTVKSHVFRGKKILKEKMRAYV